MSKETGGPAFPKQPHRLTNGMLEGNNEGMTLRDYFAAKALGGYIAFMGCEANAEDRLSGKNKDVLARNAYQYADAMLKAREEE